MDEKVYTPEVLEETPYPGGIEPFVLPTSSPKDTYSPTTTKETVVSRKKTAVELLSNSLNTRSRKVLQQFELQQSGGFQIGNYQEGTTGDVRITPNGLTTRDQEGKTTFALDSTTGDAVFAGSLEAGNVVTGDVLVRDDTTNRITIDGVNGFMKVSRPGYDVLTTADINLVFHSNYSMFREVALQTIPEDRFTDSATYVAYDDAQVRVNFSDWSGVTFYHEGIMKTGAGTGFVRLVDLVGGAEYGEIQTSSTTAVSVRSAAGLSALTGTHNFREEQKITGGGGAFTDIYIGRLLFRYDF